MEKKLRAIVRERSKHTQHSHTHIPETRAQLESASSEELKCKKKKTIS